MMWFVFLYYVCFFVCFGFGFQVFGLNFGFGVWVGFWGYLFFDVQNEEHAVLACSFAIFDLFYTEDLET